MTRALLELFWDPRVLLIVPKVEMVFRFVPGRAKFGLLNRL